MPIDGAEIRCRADRLAADLPATAWTRRSAGDGSKGPRFYDWAWLADVGADGDPDDDGRHSLLIRRNNTTGELAFYRCWAPRPATLAQLVRVAGVRWIVEESFQAGKGQVGLDQHQVRRWTSWHRFTTLALAALAVLAICAADARSADRPAQPDMIDLTINEIRRRSACSFSFCRRSFSNSSCSLFFRFGRPAPAGVPELLSRPGLPSRPASRARVHSMMCDEYKPSRRRRAPFLRSGHSGTRRPSPVCTPG